MFPFVQRPHGRLYKATRCQSQRRGPQNQCQVTNNSQISLSIQLDQITTNSERLKSKFTNPNRFRSKLSQNQWNLRVALRDSTESSSLSRCFCNSSIESIARSNKFNTITETLRLRRRRGKEFQGFWTGWEEERQIIGLFPDFDPKINKQNQDRSILKIQNQISE